MSYLLDTHTFLWMRHTPDRLGEEARAICRDIDNISPFTTAILSTGSSRPRPWRRG